MSNSGNWFFRFKGSASATVFSGTVPGFDDDNPGVFSEPNSGCLDGNAYHIVATNRNNVRYATSLQFSTCGSGALTILEATFTPDVNADNEPHDCINGICIKADVYDTPGGYSTKADCELVCGINPDGLICMTSGEYGTIQKKLQGIIKKACD